MTLGQKRKRKRKRLQRATQFRAGHRPWNKGLSIEQVKAISSYCRPTQDEESLYVRRDRKGNILQNEIETLNEVGRTMILRPKKLPGSRIARLLGEKEEDSDEVEGYRIWHAKIAVYACASAQRQHDQRQPCCKGVVRLSARGETKKGLATLETLVCDRCKYESPRRKFYGEVSTKRSGAKMAVPNMGAQIAMFNSPIGPQVFREIMAALDLPVPTRSGLQRQANRFAKLMERLNKKDMQAWRETVKKIHVQKGNDPGSGIPIQGDTRYRSPLRSGRGKKPGQPSGMSITNVAENVTDRNIIIASHLRNKICPTCNYYEGRGKKVPPHECVANIPEDAVIGDERQAAKDIAKELLSGPSKTPVGSSLSDGDSSFNSGMAEVMMEEAGQKVTSLTDTVHRGKGVRTRVTRGKWSKNMFPGESQKQKDDVKNRFGQDLMKRLATEHRRALKKFGTEKKKEIVAKMKSVMQTIPYCYAGDHSRCLHGSLVCRHPNVWQAYDLPDKTRGHIHPNAADLKVLQKIMEHRLGEPALKLMRTGRTTNKVESVNRQISKTCPKNVAHSRTLGGRAAAAIHSSNNGTGMSIALKRAAANIPLSPNSAVVPALDEMDRRQNYQRSYKMEVGNKQRVQAKIRKRFAAYDMKKEEGTYKSKKVVGQSKGKGRSVGKGRHKGKAPKKKAEHSYTRAPEEEPPNEWSPSESDLP